MSRQKLDDEALESTPRVWSTSFATMADQQASAATTTAAAPAALEAVDEEVVEEGGSAPTAEVDDGPPVAAAKANKASAAQPADKTTANPATLPRRNRWDAPRTPAFLRALLFRA